MPVDSSIYGMIQQPQVPDPLANYGKALSLQNMMGQQDLQALQTGQLRKSIATEDAVSKAIQGSQGDPATIKAAYLKAGDVKGLQAWEKAQREAEKDTAGILKTKLESSKMQIEQARDMIAQLGPGSDMKAFKENMTRLYGPDIAAKVPVPDTYDPEWQKKAILNADHLNGNLQKQLEWGVTTRGQDIAAQTAANSLAETKRHNPVMEGIARQNAGTAAGQLAETRANNQRPVYDMDRGGFASRPQPGKEASFIPVTGAPKSQRELTGLREDTDNLRKEFEAKPTVKAYRDVIPIAGAAQTAPDTRAGDIQMAYAVGKILDPASVVREGELKLVGDAATVMNKIEGQLRTLTQGKGRLNPETRAELNAMLNNAVAQRQASFEAEKASYGGIVSRRGYKPEDVFIDTPAAAAKPTAKGVPDSAPTQAQIDAELRRRGVIR